MKPINGRNNLTFHLSMFKCDGFYMLDTIRPHPYIGSSVTYCAVPTESCFEARGGLAEEKNETNYLKTLFVQ